VVESPINSQTPCNLPITSGPRTRIGLVTPGAPGWSVFLLVSEIMAAIGRLPEHAGRPLHRDSDAAQDRERNLRTIEKSDATPLRRRFAQDHAEEIPSATRSSPNMNDPPPGTSGTVADPGRPGGRPLAGTGPASRRWLDRQRAGECPMSTLLMDILVQFVPHLRRPHLQPVAGGET